MKVTRILVLLFAFLLIFPHMNVEAGKYNPVDIESHWAKEEIQQFLRSSLLEGYETSNGVYEVKPKKSISRAEFVTMLNRVLELEMGKHEVHFDDVQGRWYVENVYIAASNDLIEGIGGNEFQPDRPITRAEIAAVIVRAFEQSINFSQGTPKAFDDVSEHWGLEAINKASRVGIIKGISTSQFAPEQNAKRAEAIVMLKRALDKETAGAPSEDEIVTLVNGYNQERKSALEEADIERIKALQDWTTGYQGVMQSIAIHYDIQSVFDAGVEYDFTEVTQADATATKLTKRFAEVEVTNGKYEKTTKRPLTENEYREITSEHSDAGLYQLHKENGAWKIYYIDK